MHLRTKIVIGVVPTAGQNEGSCCSLPGGNAGRGPPLGRHVGTKSPIAAFGQAPVAAPWPATARRSGTFPFVPSVARQRPHPYDEPGSLNTLVRVARRASGDAQWPSENT